MARACPATFLSAVASAYAAGLPIVKFGNARLKDAYAERCLNGDYVGAFALSEAGSGADPAAIATTAEKKKDRWVLRGAKAYVTNAPIADFIVVAARTKPGSGPDGISLFLVDARARGVKSVRLSLMGHRGAPVGDLDVRCEVGEDDLIGNEGEGFGYMMHALQAARLAAAVGALGIGVSCLEHSLERARERVSCGEKIIKFQEVSFKLAQMRLMTDVSRLLVQHAAWCMDEHAPDAASAVSCAKVYATESATKISHMAVQIFGASGYTAGCPAERLYRDARLGEILWGPSEVQRVMLARDVLSKVRP